MEFREEIADVWTDVHEAYHPKSEEPDHMADLVDNPRGRAMGKEVVKETADGVGKSRMASELKKTNYEPLLARARAYSKSSGTATQGRFRGVRTMTSSSSRTYLWVTLTLLGGIAVVLAVVANVLLSPEPGRSSGTHQAKDVAGVWSSEAGGRLEFTAAGEFSASNVRLEPRCADSYDAGRRDERFSGTGKWKFGSFPDEADGMTMEFTPTGSAPDLHTCTVYSMFRGTPARPAIQLHQDMGTPERYERTEQLDR
ncbi:hypothetical protein [Streptomyces sp. NPDC096339]|uniref:hypothetical protein n=1 Tax=Streptomyces sp. NPDC096339 TaxID=3366086 RepID=UPI003810306C